MSLYVLTEDDLELETYCGKCYGKGSIGMAKCRDCEGLGYYPTRLGEKLLTFLKRHKIG